MFSGSEESSEVPVPVTLLTSRLPASTISAFPNTQLLKPGQPQEANQEMKRQRTGENQVWNLNPASGTGLGRSTVPCPSLMGCRHECEHHSPPSVTRQQRQEPGTKCSKTKGKNLVVKKRSLPSLHTHLSTANLSPLHAFFYFGNLTFSLGTLF